MVPLPDDVAEASAMWTETVKYGTSGVSNDAPSNCGYCGKTYTCYLYGDVAEVSAGRAWSYAGNPLLGANGDGAYIAVADK